MLNSVEKLKLKRKPNQYLADIEDIDLENITKEQRFYLKSIGIYNFKATPEICMIRVRVSGGNISVKQLEQIVSISDKYNTEIILTSRGQVEFHDIQTADIFKIYQDIRLTGLNCYQTLSDNIRNIMSDPLDGVGLSNKIETYPIVKDIESVFLKKEEFISSIPRKFNIAISGNSSNIIPFFSNDLYFALAVKDNIYGFNIYLGGRNIQIAQSADIFVQKEDVKDVSEAVLKAFNKYGSRGSRNKTRLFHLLETIGIEKFKSYMSEFYNKKLETSGKTLITKEKYDQFIPIKESKYCFRYQTSFGRIDKFELLKIIEFVKQEDLQIRFGGDQNIYLIGLKSKESPFENNQGSSNILACAGSKYCFFSIFDVKEKSNMLDIKKLERYNISFGYSGCLKGCGRHRFCDIGLISVRINRFGEKEEGVRLFLGALHTTGDAINRLIFWTVPLRELNNLIDLIIDEFLHSGYGDFEEFSLNVLNKYSEDFLSAWFICKIYTAKKIYLQPSKQHSINIESEIEYLKSSFQHPEISPVFQNGFKELNRLLIDKTWAQSKKD